MGHTRKLCSWAWNRTPAQGASGGGMVLAQAHRTPAAAMMEAWTIRVDRRFISYSS